MLLDFDDLTSGPATIMAISAPLIPNGQLSLQAKSVSAHNVIPAAHFPNRSIELLSSLTTSGLTISYKFPRRPFLYSAKMVTVEFTFVNSSSEALNNIKILRKKLPPRVEVHDFHEIVSLEANQTLHATLGIDFCDTTQNVGLTIGCNGKEFDTVLKPTVGEMLCPIAVNQSTFNGLKANLSGLNENYANIDLPIGLQTKKGISTLVLDTANVARVAEETNGGMDESALRFVGQTVSSGSPVLVTVVTKGAKATVTVNCEKVLVGSVVLKELKDAVVRSATR